MNPSPPPGAAADPASPGFYSAESLLAEQSIGFLMKQALSSIAAQVDRRLAEHDLTHAQWLPLYKLTRCGACPAVELARQLHLDPAAVTRALDRLEAKGLVQRTRSQTDRRIVMIDLTEAGRSAAAQVPAVLADVLNRHLHGFTPAEWHTLVELLQRLVANSENSADALRPYPPTPEST